MSEIWSLTLRVDLRVSQFSRYFAHPVCRGRGCEMSVGLSATEANRAAEKTREQ